MTRLKIGIVGCGAIGSSLAKAIVRDFSKEAELAALYDLDRIKSQNLAKLFPDKGNLAARGLKQLIKRSELVIEAASAKSSWEIARLCLSGGCDIMIMSVGGLLSHFEKLRALAKKKNCKVYIPSGAISGIDALKAAGIGKINKVTLTTVKHPISFKGVRYVQDRGICLDKIKKDKILFSGKAREAVRYFPQNINVAAALSMAGIGQDKTKVRIIASPRATKNIHEIQIEASAGRIFTRTQNLMHPDNPKTSYLAVLSAIATLKQILGPIKIGT